MLNEGEANKQNNPFKNPRKSKSGHIYFNESGEMVSTTTNNTTSNSITTRNNSKTKAIQNENAKTNFIFQCALKEPNALGEAPREFHNQKANKKVTEETTAATTTTKSPKKVVEIRELIIINPAGVEGLNIIKNPDEIIDKEKTADCKEQQQNNSSLLPLNETESTANTTILKSQNSCADQSMLQGSALDCSLNAEEESNINEEAESLMAEARMCVSPTDTDEEEELSKSLSQDDEYTSGIIADGTDKTSPNDESITSQVIDDSAESDIEEVSEIIDLNDSEDVSIHPASTTGRHSMLEASQLKINKILPLCKNIVGETKVDDVLIFKVGYLIVFNTYGPFLFGIFILN